MKKISKENKNLVKIILEIENKKIEIWGTLPILLDEV